MLKVDNMVTADGAELRPRLTEIVTGLLDALPGHAGPDGAVDLRRHLASPVPMQVICELTGVRYPDLTLAVPDGSLTPVPSFFSNSVQRLPVRLGSRVT